MSPAVATIVTSSFTALFVVLLLIEQARHKRYLRSFRILLDSLFEVSLTKTDQMIPKIDSGFVRNFFHYVTHVLLSIVLRILEELEHVLKKIAKFNRTKAREVAGVSKGNSDSHLQKIADHKEAVSLTAEERLRRKEDALSGEL